MTEREHTIIYRPWRVLVVCTANVCRSPVAQRLLQRSLDKRGVPARVLSAGTRGGTLQIQPETLKAAAVGRISLDDHVSRAYDEELGAKADVILTMERSHLQEIVGNNADLWGKTYTLKGLLRRAEEVNPTGLTRDTWLEALGHGRNPSELVGSGTQDDVIDPYGLPVPAHIAMTANLNEDVEILAGHLAALELPAKEPST